MSIKISKKHGVNPSIVKCIYCNQEIGIALLGKLKGDEEAPKYCNMSPLPCAECIEKATKEKKTYILETTDTVNPCENLTGRYTIVDAEILKIEYSPIAFTTPETLKELTE